MTFQLITKVLGQSHVEGILRSHLSDLGVKVELGTTLLSFTQNADCVTTELATDEGTSEQANFDFLIGADGGRGTIYCHFCALYTD